MDPTAALNSARPPPERTYEARVKNF